jgi:D-glycero-alpha-D-manno-heptose 1-phosphate guanylyltransferase
VVTEAIILAGGLGTRLRSVVPDAPKVMASVAGQPFLAYLLQFLEANGLRRIVLAVGYRNEAIRGFFGSRFGSLELVYSVEEEPLGTGGALLQSLAYVDGPSALVLNGDTFLRLNYRAMAVTLDNEPRAQLVVALRRVADTSRYGAAIVADGRIQGFTARGTPAPGLINAGSYLIARDIFQRYPMPAKFSWEADFLETRAPEVRPIAFECEVPFIDIGIPEALEEAQTLIPEWMNATA